jgi:hypothetical protein
VTMRDVNHIPVLMGVPMSHSTRAPHMVAIGLAAVILSACSAAVGGQPSPSAPASPAAPSLPASPTVTPEPAQPTSAPTPTAPATPDAPAESPKPSEAPIKVIRLPTGVHVRVTADGVAVRQLPGLDQPLVIGYDFVEGGAPEVRLDDGDVVGIIWGPVLVDGHTWYSVKPHDTGTVTFSEGWIAADFLVENNDPPLSYPTVLTADGLGSGKAVSGEVTDFSPLYVNVVAAPMPGDASCEAEVVLIGTDGEAVTIGASEVTEPMQFFSSPLENDALFQAAAGKVTLQVRSDCSWAGMAFVPAG